MRRRGFFRFLWRSALGLAGAAVVPALVEAAPLRRPGMKFVADLPLGLELQRMTASEVLRGQKEVFRRLAGIDPPLLSDAFDFGQMVSEVFRAVDPPLIINNDREI